MRISDWSSDVCFSDLPDVFLGRLQDNGNDVHQLVANAIDLPGSQPNSLHHAITGLAVVHPSPRIVPTNYDRHQIGIASGRERVCAYVSISVVGLTLKHTII